MKNILMKELKLTLKGYSIWIVFILSSLFIFLQLMNYNGLITDKQITYELFRNMNLILPFLFSFLAVSISSREKNLKVEEIIKSKPNGKNIILAKVVSSIILLGLIIIVNIILADIIFYFKENITMNLKVMLHMLLLSIPGYIFTIVFSIIIGKMNRIGIFTYLIVPGLFIYVFNYDKSSDYFLNFMFHKWHISDIVPFAIKYRELIISRIFFLLLSVLILLLYMTIKNHYKNSIRRYLNLILVISVLSSVFCIVYYSFDPGYIIQTTKQLKADDRNIYSISYNQIDIKEVNNSQIEFAVDMTIKNINDSEVMNLDFLLNPQLNIIEVKSNTKEIIKSNQVDNSFKLSPSLKPGEFIKIKVRYQGSINTGNAPIYAKAEWQVDALKRDNYLMITPAADLFPVVSNSLEDKNKISLNIINISGDVIKPDNFDSIDDIALVTSDLYQEKEYWDNNYRLSLYTLPEHSVCWKSFDKEFFKNMYYANNIGLKTGNSIKVVEIPRGHNNESDEFLMKITDNLILMPEQRRVKDWSNNSFYQRTIRSAIVNIFFNKYNIDKISEELEYGLKEFFILELKRLDNTNVKEEIKERIDNITNMFASGLSEYGLRMCYKKGEKVLFFLNELRTIRGDEFNKTLLNYLKTGKPDSKYTLEKLISYLEQKNYKEILLKSQWLKALKGNGDI